MHFVILVLKFPGFVNLHCQFFFSAQYFFFRVQKREGRAARCAQQVSVANLFAGWRLLCARARKPPGTTGSLLPNQMPGQNFTVYIF